ncbi:MAG TPA: choice-of-anchor D domain-containing protein [Solirubrobacterales bacterium]
MSKSAGRRFAFSLLAMLLVALAAASFAAAAPEEGEEGTPAPPQLVFEPDHYDFGLQPLNWGSQQATFQLRNVGGEPFQIGGPQISGPGSSAFWTGNSNCYGATLQPGDACYAQINFGPYSIDEYTAQFSVNVGSYSFAADLSGTGGRATFAPAASTTDFGVARVGSPGTVREIAISNTGNMPGGVFIAVIAGGAIGSFQILDENCTGVELVPDATCTLQVRFQPVSEGVKKATLGLFGESEGPTPIVLTGVGSAPIVVAAAAGVAGQDEVGASSSPRSRHGKRRQKAIQRAKRRRAALNQARLVLRAQAGE